MCKIINFNEYRRNKVAKKVVVQTEMKAEGFRKLSVRELVTKEWAEEYMRNRWGLSKLVFHIIEQYGYIRCTNKEKYVFEDVKRDVKYCEMYPEIENKRFKAPLWVKISGEWYFVEMYVDSAGQKAFENKMNALTNYGVKGFRVDLFGLKTQEFKRMLEDNDIVGVVGKINDAYYNSNWISKYSSACITSVAFGGEKTKRECTYKVLEQAHYYAVLEGTELETGDKHMVFVYENSEKKEHAEYFRNQYGKTGLPLLYVKCDMRWEKTWQNCIRHSSRLYKRFM